MNLDLLEFKRQIEIKDGLRSSTAGSYVQMIDRFFRDANKPTSAIRESDIISYLSKCRINGFSQNSLRLSITALKRFFKWYSFRNRFIDPTKEIKQIREKVVDPLLPSFEQISKVIYNIFNYYQKSSNEQSKFRFLRDAALILFLVDSGLRIGELIQVKLGDISIDKNNLRVNVRSSKNYMSRVIAFGKLSDGLLIGEVLSTWLIYRNTTLKSSRDYYLFPRSINDLEKPLTRATIYRKLNRYWKLAGYERKIGPHTLRHFYATFSFANGLDLEIIRQNLGHKWLSSTQRYIRLAEIMKARSPNFSPGSVMKSSEIGLPDLQGFSNILLGMRSKINDT